MKNIFYFLIFILSIISCNPDSDNSEEIDLSGNWKLTIENCSNCNQAIITFNNDGTITSSFQNPNTNVTVNDYTLNGNDLIINYTEEFLECNGLINVIQAENMSLDYISTNTFSGSYNIQIIGGSTQNCFVESDSLSENVILTKQ